MRKRKTPMHDALSDVEDFLSPSWTERRRVRYDYTNSLAAVVGEKHGVPHEELKRFAKDNQYILKEFRRKEEKGELGFTQLPSTVEYREQVSRFLLKAKGKFDYLVVLGIGGSALGLVALQEALKPEAKIPYAPPSRRVFPSLHVVDNVDPSLVSSVLNRVDLNRTLINVISKSGSTLETLANFLVFRSALIEAVGYANHPRHIVVTTTMGEGYLFELAQKEGYQLFGIPRNVGGRFSVLSPVGLLPAGLIGIDLMELLAGAHYMKELCHSLPSMENIPFLSAVIQHLLDTRRGKGIQVFFAYSSLLRGLARWYQQLWAESLGKRLNRQGEEVFCGQTPLVSIGTTDQHSLLQLFAEGPNNKSITFLEVSHLPDQLIIEEEPSPHEITDYLKGKSLQEVLLAERRATELSLTSSARPNTTFILPEISPFTLGELIYLFELQTAYAGELYRVNPYDQPGVEEGKRTAYAMLGRRGYREKQREIEKKLPPKRYII
ncbi:MAG: glucose-6-phosphate isomerase [Acidobacteriota bacterium]